MHSSIAAVATTFVLSLAITTSCSFSSKLKLPGQPKAKKADTPNPRGQHQERRFVDQKPLRQDPPPPDVAKEANDAMEKVLVVYEPSKGHKKVEPMSPPWCAVAGEAVENHTTAGRIVRELNAEFFSTRTVASIGAGLCTFPDQDAFKKQTAYFIQSFMSQTGLNQKDAIKSLTARMNEDKWKAMQKETCTRYEDDDELAGFDAAKRSAMRRFFGCRGGESLTWLSPAGLQEKFFSHYDRFVEPPSELLRAASILECYGNLPSASEFTAFNFTKYGLCHQDRKNLNRMALEAELKDAKYNAFAVAVARESFGRAKKNDELLGAALQKAIAKDADYKKIFIDAPKRGWKEWKKTYAANKGAYKNAYKVLTALHGNSRKAIRKCGQKERDGLAAFIASHRVTDFESAKRLIASAAARPLFGAVMTCAAVHQSAPEHALFKSIYQYAQEGGGPRWASLIAMQAALGEIMADRQRFKVTPASLYIGNNNLFLGHEKLLKRDDNYIMMNDHQSGVVKSIRKEGDQYLVTFRAERTKEATYSCRNTKRIWKISGGTVIYHRSCRRTGSKINKHVVPPLLIPAYSRAGIKAGVHLEFKGHDPVVSRGKKGPGYPVAVYASPEKKRLIAAFGYSLK